MNITAKELSGLHIGKTVTVEVRRFPNMDFSPKRELTGMITNIEHDSEIVEDRAICESTNRVGAIPNTVRITIDSREKFRFEYNRIITIQED